MIENILQFLMGFVAGYALIFLVKWFFIYRNADRLKQEVSAIIKDHCKVVRVETVDDIHLMYDHLTGNFVCQGKDEGDLWRRAYELFPSKEFIIRSEFNGQPTFIVKG